MLLNNACLWTIHKWLRRNHGLALQIWIPWRYHVGTMMQAGIWKLNSKPKTVCELKVVLCKLDNLPQVQLIKLKSTWRLVRTLWAFTITRNNTFAGRRQLVLLPTAESKLFTSFSDIHFNLESNHTEESSNNAGEYLPFYVVQLVLYRVTSCAVVAFAVKARQKSNKAQ